MVLGVGRGGRAVRSYLNRSQKGGGGDWVSDYAYLTLFIYFIGGKMTILYKLLFFSFSFFKPIFLSNRIIVLIHLSDLD